MDDRAPVYVHHLYDSTFLAPEVLLSQVTPSFYPIAYTLHIPSTITDTNPAPFP